MRVLAIDPGPTHSGLVVAEVSSWPPTVLAAERPENETVIAWCHRDDLMHLLCEEIVSYGMPAGRSLFQTEYWCGRFVQAFVARHATRAHCVTRLDRRTVKLALCGTMRANDAAIRQAILDCYGSTRTAAVGTKQMPGPLYGVRRDAWQALALILAWREVPRSTVSLVS